MILEQMVAEQLKAYKLICKLEAERMAQIFEKAIPQKRTSSKTAHS